MIDTRSKASTTVDGCYTPVDGVDARAGQTVDKLTGVDMSTCRRPVTYLVRLRPKPGVDPVRALRGALKVLLRRFGLKAVEVKEEETTA